MKSKILLVVLLYVFNNTYSQTTKNNAIKTKHSYYIQINIQPFLDGTVLLGANYYYKKNYGLKMFFSESFYTSPEKPEGYYSSGLFGKSYSVFDKITSANLLVSKLFTVDNVQFSFSSGISYNKNEYATNFKFVEEDGGWFSHSGYRYEKKNRKFYGFVIEGQIDILFGRLFGLNIGLGTNLNKAKNLYYFNLGFIFGRINKKKK